MNLHLIAWVALDAIEHLEAAPAARPFDGIIGIGDLLQFLEHKPRHDDDAFDKIRFDQISDAAVNDGAGVEEQEVVRFVARRKADVRDDERKILLVAAHGQHDADVAERQKQTQPHEQARAVIHLFEQTGAVNEQGHHRAEQQPESRGGKRAQRKALEHFVHRDHQPAEAEPDDQAEEAGRGIRHEAGEHLADGVVVGHPVRLRGEHAPQGEDPLGIPVVYEVRGFLEETWASLPGQDEAEAVEADRYRLSRAAETRAMLAATASARPKSPAPTKRRR